MIGPELEVRGTQDLVDEAEGDLNNEKYDEGDLRTLKLDSLSAYIMEKFQENRDAKRATGSNVEADLLNSLRAYNGEYSESDAQKIVAQGEANIFMNITATKVRVAKAWITDILKPANEKAWMLSPSPMPELPEEMGRQIEEALKKEFEEAAKKKAEAKAKEEAQKNEQSAGAPAPGMQGAPQGGAPQPVPPTSPQPKPSVAKEAQKSIIEQNRDRRELKEAVLAEIDEEAKFQVGIQEREIHDQMTEGGWDEAFEEFIHDFCIFKTAFLKGPIVTRKNKLVYEDGKPVGKPSIHYTNKRVSPFDIFPSPHATCLQDGNLLELLRLSASELQGLRELKSYSKDKINKVLEEGQMGHPWLDEGLEDEKDDLENKDSVRDDMDTIYGLHFFGSVKVELLREWGMKGLKDESDGDVLEVEAILAGDEVIKVKKNPHPLLKRPYYSASYVKIPGSVWGRSLPEMMDSTQRMCNATARAIATNMGMSSGPQVEMYVDRLADNGNISQMTPRKIWQVKSDVGGAGGRALQFFNVPSNARELLEVYREFESRADDVTGIPRYAYGADPKGAGQAATAAGLSMMLESATKIVKDSIRCIDNGLIKPRIEYQFFQNMLKNGEKAKYTGDIFVIPKGSAALTIKAAQNLRRNELLQITANQNDQAIMGAEARMDMLRPIADDLGMPNVIPPAFKVRQIDEENKQRAAEASQKPDHGLEVAKMQTESAERVAQMNAELKKAADAMKIQVEQMKEQGKQQVELAKLQAKSEANQQAMMVKLREIEASISKQNQEIAVKLREGSGI